MCSLPGGECQLKKTLATNSRSVVPTIAYQVPDESWDIAVVDILQINQIDIPSISPTGHTFVCHSSLALAFKMDPVSYCITLRFDHSASWEWLDFVKRGGPCKHIQVAVFCLNNLQEQHGLNLPEIQLPSSAEDACMLQACRLSDLPAANQVASTFACYAKLDWTSCHHSWGQVVRVRGHVSSQYGGFET